MKTSYNTHVNGKEIEVKWIDENTIYFGKEGEVDNEDLSAWMESFGDDYEIEEYYKVGNGEDAFAVILKEKLSKEDFYKNYVEDLIR